MGINARYTSSELSSKFLSLLDAKDGVKDNKIAKDEWNLFAEYSGLDNTDKKFVSVEDAVAGLDVLVSNNPEKIVNYSRTYLGEAMLLKRKRNSVTSKRRTNTSVIYNEKIKAGDELRSLLHINKKLDEKTNYRQNTFSNWAVKKIVENSDNESIRKYIRQASDLVSDMYPLASQLLKISVTPKDMRTGKYGEYEVLNQAESEKFLAKLGMYKDDTNAYGKINEHLTSKQMKLKTVIFSKKSKAAEIISKTNLMKSAANFWEYKGKPNKKYYGALLKETDDCLLGINSCLVTLTKVEDKGDKLRYTGYVEDVYDFSEHYTKGEDNIKSKVIDTINYGAYLAQEKGALQPYRVLIPFEVELPKSE